MMSLLQCYGTVTAENVAIIFFSCFLPAAVMSLVLLLEFYFGDANLARDRFLHHLIDENPDGSTSQSPVVN